jgi:pyruvate dehydrogenase E2 component (dihydrolipoamide acetyltransferase)
MKQVIKIPSLGDAENTEVIEICVNPGDSVGSEDSIVVLESEKAAMDVPASKNGVVKKVLVKIGDEVKEGDDFLEIEITEEEIKEDDSDKEDENDIQEDDNVGTEEIIEKKKVEEIIEEPKFESSASGIYAGPAVRKLAREFGIDLNKVIATGPRNRILKEDLHKFVKSKLEGSSGGIPKMPSIDFSEFGNVEEIDLTKFQKTSALNLQQSWITIPHVTQHDETSIDELLTLRKSLMEKFKVKVSPLAFFAKGISKLLEEFPLFNASIDMNTMKIIKKDFINLGIAVDTPQGLIVPNIKSANKMSIREISDEIARLANLSKSRKIKVADLKGSTFTISSLGSFGGKFFTPIINPPEVAILGISKSYDSVLLKDNKPISITNLPISLSYDHRIINGVQGVEFTSRFCEILSDISYFEESF